MQVLRRVAGIDKERRVNSRGRVHPAKKPSSSSLDRVTGARLDRQHRLGARAFSRKYRIDLWALAAEFARRSPDWQMRASLKLIDAVAVDGAPLSHSREEASDVPAISPR